MNRKAIRELPYKIILEEQELPQNWYNMRADMPGKVASLLDPETMEPVTTEALQKVFCTETAAQEMDEENRLIPIPEDVRHFYKMYRPSPLIHAEYLEKLQEMNPALDHIQQLWKTDYFYIYGVE